MNVEFDNVLIDPKNYFCYYIEETGLNYNWWRWYKEEVGRYVQNDMFISKYMNKLNLFIIQKRLPDTYQYSGNNPEKYIDVEGLESRDKVIECLGKADRCIYKCWIDCWLVIYYCIKDSSFCVLCFLRTGGKVWLCKNACSYSAFSCYGAEECLFHCERECDKELKKCLCIK